MISLPSPCSLHPQPFNRSLRNVEAGRFRAAGHNALRRMHTRLAFGKGDVLIDVGSYEGADLLRLAVASPDAHVHSYDPSAPPRLRQNMRQLPHVHLHPVVLDIAHVLSRFEAVALLQLNCEGCEREVIERLTAIPSAVARVRAIEMQVHPAFSFLNGLTDAQYCELERRLRRDYHLVYRFAYVWELWVHKYSNARAVD